MVGRFLKKFYVYLILFFLYAPIIVLIIFSFNKDKTRVSFTGFTFKWYIELFKDRQVLSALYYTLLVGLLSAVIATLIGTLAAIGIENHKKLSKSIYMNVTYVSMVNPDIVIGISLMLLFAFLKIKGGFLTMLLAHITFNIPYVIISVQPKLKQLDKNLYEAALDLGANERSAFFKVILPEIMPGIFSGFLLALTLSLDDFVISFFTTGPSVQNLSIVIFSMARKGINPIINALSTIMFIVVISLLVIVNLRKSKADNKIKRDMKKLEKY